MGNDSSILMMSFYEFHLNNLKTIILQQNETINNQKKQLESTNETLGDYKDKLALMEEKLRGKFDIMGSYLNIAQTRPAFES